MSTTYRRPWLAAASAIASGRNQGFSSQTDSTC